jgi:hypothetical protein
VVGAVGGHRQAMASRRFLEGIFQRSQSPESPSGSPATPKGALGRGEPSGDRGSLRHSRELRWESVGEREGVSGRERESVGGRERESVGERGGVNGRERGVSGRLRALTPHCLPLPGDGRPPPQVPGDESIRHSRSIGLQSLQRAPLDRGPRRAARLASRAVQRRAAPRRAAPAQARRRSRRARKRRERRATKAARTASALPALSCGRPGARRY